MDATVYFFKQQVCPVPYHFLMADKKLTYDITFKYVSESKSPCKLHIRLKKSTTRICFFRKGDTKNSSVLENVFIKESDNGVFEFHIDTDDANACLIKNGDVGIVLDHSSNN